MWASPELGFPDDKSVRVAYFDPAERKWVLPSSGDARFIISPFYAVLYGKKRSKKLITLLE